MTATWPRYGDAMFTRHGHAMDTTWTHHGHIMNTPWSFHDRTTDAPWTRHGGAMAMSWPHHEHTMDVHGITMTRPWCVHGMAMVCSWYVHGIFTAYNVAKMGATVGSLVGCGMLLKKPKPTVSEFMLKVWPRYAGYGAAAGVVTASAMMCWKMKSIDADGVEDRGYRIVLNKGVQTMDFYSNLGGITCGAMTGAKMILPPLSLVAQGIAAGSVGYILGNALGLPLQKVGGAALSLAHVVQHPSLLELLLPVLLAVHTEMGVFDRSALGARGHRAENDLESLQRQAALVEFNSTYRARPNKFSRQGLHLRQGVSARFFRGVVKAKEG
eukprot:jgi/Undpi1/7022/HiC_scaffold_21.g09496.m1